METKTLKIQIPKGYEIDKEKSTFEQIVFRKKKKQLPEKWEDLETIQGYCTTCASEIEHLKGTPGSHSRNTFKTKEQAEAAIALAQLSQLVYGYNEGWEPDWTSSEDKYVIYFSDDEIYADDFKYVKRFLAFKTRELRDKFLENFRDLIEKAKPLL